MFRLSPGRKLDPEQVWLNTSALYPCRSVSNGKLGVRPESKLTKTKRAPSGGALVALLDDASGTAPEAGKRSATAPDPLGPTGGRPQLGALDMLNVALPAPRRTSASRLINAAVTFLPVSP